MKNLATSIMLALGTIPLAVSAYTLTVNVDGSPTVYTVDSASFSSDANGALLEVTGLDTGGGSGPYSPVFTSTGSYSKQENSGTTVGTVTATDQDGDGVTFGFGGGVDDSKFNLSTAGALTFKAAPDYEVPTDSGSNHVYNIVVTATDDSATNESTNKSISVSVTNDTSDDPTGGGGNCDTSGVTVAYGFDLNNPGSQTMVDVRRTEIVSMPFTALSDPTAGGTFSIASTTGNSDVRREISVTQCPDTVFDISRSNMCAKTGTSSTVLKFQHDQLNSKRCTLEPGKQYYLNVRSTNCTAIKCNVNRNIYMD